MTPETIAIAKILGAHGVHGNVRVQTYTDDLAQYPDIFDSRGNRYTIKNSRVHKQNILIIKFVECSDRNTAEALKGTELFINKSELAAAAEDEFYYSDLIGLQVFDQDGKDWGTIKNVANYGAEDILDIGEFMVPFIKDAVPEVDVAGGKVVINNSYLIKD